MTKRSSDQSPCDQRKAQRSGEGNKERAYVAASRRNDRSIEARVQSALMASEVHQRRTGHALHITRAIVLNESMYEEVDQGFPRSMELLRPYDESSLSASSDTQGQAYLNNQAAMSSLVTSREKRQHENNVHHEFAKHFPHAHQTISQPWPTAGVAPKPPAQCNADFNSPTEDSVHSVALSAYSIPQEPSPDAQCGACLTESFPPPLDADIPSPPAASAEATPEFPATLPLQGESAFEGDNKPLEMPVALTSGDLIDPAVFGYQQQACAGGAQLHNSPMTSKHIKANDFSDFQDSSYLSVLDLTNWDPYPNATSDDEDYWKILINDMA